MRSLGTAILAASSLVPALSACGASVQPSTPAPTPSGCHWRVGQALPYRTDTEGAAERFRAALVADRPTLWGSVRTGAGLRDWSLAAQRFDDDGRATEPMTAIDPSMQTTFFAGPFELSRGGSSVVLYQHDNECRTVELSAGSPPSAPVAQFVEELGRCDTLAWNADGYSYLQWRGAGETRSSVALVTVSGSPTRTLRREALPASFAMGWREQLLASEWLGDHSARYLVARFRDDNSLAVVLRHVSRSDGVSEQLLDEATLPAFAQLIPTREGTLVFWDNHARSIVQWALLRGRSLSGSTHTLSITQWRSNQSAPRIEAIATSHGAMLMVAWLGAISDRSSITLVPIAQDGTPDGPTLSVDTPQHQRSFASLAASRSGALLFVERRPDSTSTPADSVGAAEATPIHCD